jgi:hypothetical protein
VTAFWILLAVAALAAGADWIAVGARHRFVRPLPAGKPAVHVTYHLAQGLLVLPLLHWAVGP